MIRINYWNMAYESHQAIHIENISTVQVNIWDCKVPFHLWSPVSFLPQCTNTHLKTEKGCCPQKLVKAKWKSYVTSIEERLCTFLLFQWWCRNRISYSTVMYRALRQKISSFWYCQTCHCKCWCFINVVDGWTNKLYCYHRDKRN